MIVNIPCVPHSLCGFTAVPYEIWGNEKGPWIGLMGESPYHEEVKIGRPFVGRSGQLLRRVIDDSKFKFFIFNSVACMPIDKNGNAFKPTDEMVRRCKVNRQMIYKYLPAGTLIVLLGRFAIKTALGNEKIPFGTFVEKDEYVYYTSYHPSWALRGRSNFNRFVEILRRINIVKRDYYEFTEVR